MHKKALRARFCHPECSVTQHALSDTHSGRVSTAKCLPLIDAKRACAAWDEGGYDRVLQWYLQDLQARRQTRYTSPFLFAELYARLGQADAMFRWLEVSLAERSPRLCELRTNPWFNRYRSLGKFRSVEKRIGY